LISLDVTPQVHFLQQLGLACNKAFAHTYAAITPTIFLANTSWAKQCPPWIKFTLF
jgi:hypothetical protein